MNSIVHLNQIVQVKKLRHFGAATVDLVNSDGSLRKRDRSVVIRFPDDVLEVLTPGSLWQISGTESIRQYDYKDVTIVEYLIDPTEVIILRPAGRILARWISANIPRVGPVIANRLVRLKNLDAAIHGRDVERLMSVSGVTKSIVDHLFEKWPKKTFFEIIQWLESHALPLGLADRLTGVFGDSALDKLKANPFLLLALGASFEKTIKIAESFGFTKTDEIVLAGTALHAAQERSFNSSSTLIVEDQLTSDVENILDLRLDSSPGELAATMGLLVKVGNGYQTYGAALMEQQVANFISGIHVAGSDAQNWKSKFSREKIQSALSKHESSLLYSLTAEQRNAITESLLKPLSCISGGAGTGKTTILNAILAVHDEITLNEVPNHLMAIAGRAAQKMAESTGRPAHTIAKFINDAIRFPKKAALLSGLIVIDEASMVDLPSMFKLTKLFDSSIRLILIGDTAQLPPVGLGLVFHQLANTFIPFSHLTQVKRQSELSRIHLFAEAIRNANKDELDTVLNLSGGSGELVLEPALNISRLIELWSENCVHREGIILSPIKQGEFGVENINKVIQSSLNHDGLCLHYYDFKRGWIPWVTQSNSFLYEGDHVTITENNYDENADIRNGDLGVLTKVYENPDNDGSLGEIEINGVGIKINPKILSKIDLGYAITIHKSQGSQWVNCITVLPADSENMADLSLIYTAVTRPSKKLFLISERHLLYGSLDRGEAVKKRITGLRMRLISCNREP